MKHMKTRRLTTLLLAVLTCAAINPETANAEELYESEGFVLLDNLQATLSIPGESAPYIAFGVSPTLGFNVQSGSILPTSEPTPVAYDELTNVVTLEFNGVQGPHPIPGMGNVHIIRARGGKLFCSWTAVFTMELDLDTGDAILSGDGDFTILGGTGRFRNATGSFQTLFTTDIVMEGDDSALAEYTQNGFISR